MDAVANNTLRIGPGYQPDKAVVIGPGYLAPDVKVISPGACEGGDCGCDHCGEKKSIPTNRDKAGSGVSARPYGIVPMSLGEAQEMLLSQAKSKPSKNASTTWRQVPDGAATWSTEVYDAMAAHILALGVTNDATGHPVFSLTSGHKTVTAASPPPSDMRRQQEHFGDSLAWLLMGGPYGAPATRR